MKSDRSLNKLNRRDFLKLAGTTSLAALLAACSQATEEAAEEPTEAPEAAPATPEMITIRYGRHDVIDGDIENVKTFEEKYPNVKVQQEEIGDFLAKIPALAAAGTLPDVVRSWEAMVLDMGRNEQFIDIQPYVDAQEDFNPEDFYENWWNYPVVEGKRMGVPDAVAPHITYFNKKLFDGKSVEYPNPDNFTWDDFEQKAREISDPDNKVWGSETIPIGWTYFTLKQVWQNGGDFYSPDYKECWIDKKEAVEAIQYWADLLLAGDIMPSPSQIAGIGGEGVAAELFAAGQIGMQRMGSWITQVCIDAGFPWDLVPEPKKVRMDTITHGAFNAIANTSEYKQEAWNWINHRCSTEGIFNYATVGKFPGCRRTTNEIEPYPWVAQVDFDVNWDIIPRSLEYGHVLPGVVNEGEALKIIGDALQKIYLGESKAAEILPEISPQVTAVISAE